jgi:2,3-bisphosphoglycerate-dependent phosphoglycerate mutase
VATLVLLRHGRSTWNDRNLFTGWVDVDLSETGVAEAERGGRTLAEAGVLPTVCHTSLLIRAIRTAWIALDACGRQWIPVRRSWRLNERHYGALQGLNKVQTAERHGNERVYLWRRSFDVPPPPIERGSEFDQSDDPRYALLTPEIVPASECLADVIDRMMPYWYDALIPDLRAGHTVLVAAHGNSLRALVKRLEHISDDAIAALNIPTGVPRVYDLADDDLSVRSAAYLGDPDEIAAATAAVAAQAQVGGSA